MKYIVKEDICVTNADSQYYIKKGTLLSGCNVISKTGEEICRVMNGQHKNIEIVFNTYVNNTLTNPNLKMVWEVYRLRGSHRCIDSNSTIFDFTDDDWGYSYSFKLAWKDWELHSCLYWQCLGHGSKGNYNDTCTWEQAKELMQNNEIYILEYPYNKLFQ